VTSEMTLDGIIKRVWRCTWRMYLSKFEDVLGGHNEVSFEDALGGHDCARLEEYLEPVIRRRSKEGSPGTETLFISWLIHNGVNVDKLS
jgi:hypothetical protein